MRMYLLKIWQFLVNSIAGSVLFPDIIRYLLYKIAGMKINSTRMRNNIWFYGPNISIGLNSFINTEVFFHNYSKITLEENVFIGPKTMMTTVSHKIGTSNCRATDLISEEIIIKKGTWIGANATILKGVTIGEGCIIGAGAVVIEDCKPNGLYVGVPAVRIKDLN